MKQKMSNKILAIYNIIICVVWISLTLWGLLGHYGLQYTLSSMPQYAGDLKNALFFIETIFIVLTIINIIFLIQNRKTKKMIYWFIIPTTYYLNMSISIFIDIPDFLNLVLWTAIPAIIFVINLIYEIKHKKNNRAIILQVIGIIMSIILFFTNFYNSEIWLLISSIMIFVYSKKSESSSKAIKIVNTIIFLLLVGLLITFIIAFMNVISKMQKADKETAEFVNTIKSGLDKEKNLNNNILIPVLQNDKWGYIDTNGKEVIPCEYDLIPSGISDSYSDIQYPIIVTKKANDFYVYTTNGTILAQTSDNPILWIFTDYLSNHSDQAIALLSLEQLISSYLDLEPKYLSDNSEDSTIDSDDTDYTFSDNPIYIYNMEDNYILEFEADNKEEESFTLKLKKDGKILDTYEKVRCGYSEYYDYFTTKSYIKSYSSIETYSNGDVPFYSFENNYQGYYSVKKHEMKIINGNYEILDVLDNYILIKDWRNPSKTQDYLVNKDNKVILKAHLISAINDGFIVQNDNGKFSYINNNLETVADEYDFIDSTFIDNNVLICMKKIDNDNTDYTLITTQGKTLTNKKYDLMDIKLPKTEEFENYYTDFQCKAIHSEYNDFYLNPNNDTKKEGTKKDSKKEEDSSTIPESSSEWTFAKVTTEHYGNYVDLGVNLVGNETTEDDWQILYNDTHNGKVYVILSDYLPINSDFIKKINPSLDYYDYEVSSENVDNLIKAFDSKEWKSLVSENLQNIVDVKGAASIQIIIDSYNEKHKTNYHTSYPLDLYNIPEDESSGVDTLYVLPENNISDDIEYPVSYWLSDKPSDSYILTVQNYGTISQRSSDSYNALRPIVVIPSSQSTIVKKDNGKIIWKIAE